MSGLPRVCIVGPLIGANPGYVTTQGERLAAVLRRAGYPVIAVSTSTNRYVRLAEITSTLMRRRREIDIVVVYTYGLLSFVVEDIASALADRLGLPVVFALCGGTLPTFMTRFPTWTARVFRRASAIVCQSEYIAAAMRERGHAPVIIQNMIDLDLYPHQLRERVRPRLFWMRTFEPLYNPELALRVLERVRRVHADATLVFAGQDNGLRPAMEERAKAMGLAEHVEFPGFLDQAGKLACASRTDIFLNTPHIDNRPICVVEAAAFGLPVVATNVGGIPHLVEHEQTALLVPDDDADAMAAAVCRLVDEPMLAARLSAAGRRLAEKSAMTSVLPAWERILGELARPQAGAA